MYGHAEELKKSYLIRVFEDDKEYGDEYTLFCVAERQEDGSIELKGAMRPPKLSEHKAVMKCVKQIKPTPTCVYVVRMREDGPQKIILWRSK